MEDHAAFKPSTLVLYGALAAIFIALVVILLPALYYARAQKLRVSKGYLSAPGEIAELRAAQRAQLEGYRWIDREKGVLAVPIERAMELVIRDQSQGGR